MERSRRISILTSVVFGATLCVHPTLRSLIRILYPAPPELPLVDFYVQPTIEDSPIKRPNIVWIYGESLERTYMDEKQFPGLMPNLKQLEKESLSFSDIDQIGGTGWTIAGIVASQCGVPLVTTGSHGNSMDSMPSFLPGATCIGDLLRQQSYSLSFMGGANSAFAGKGKFLRTHGFEEVLGVNELSPRLEDPQYITDWGLYDDTLFKLAVEKYDRLLLKNQPFGLFLLTLDSHHPSGHVSKSCKDYPYRDGSNSMLNAVHCSDLMIANIVREITRKDPNTLVVIGSDHLAMNNVVYDRLHQQPRKNLLMYHWPSRLNPGVNNRLGSTFSSGATALDIMGFRTNGIGLGRSLLEDKPTLRESIADAEKVVDSWELEFRKLWKIPENPKSLHIDPDRKFVSFSGSIYRLPLIVDISKISKSPRLFYDDGDVPLTDVITQLGPETRSIWLDSCDRVMGVFDKKDVGYPVQVCIWDDEVKKITPIEVATDYALNF